MSENELDIVSVLPVEGDGEGMSTPQVEAALSSMGIRFGCSRTLRRALVRLCDHGQVVSVARGRALYWHRRDGARGLGEGRRSTMGFDDALILQTLERFSSKLIPAVVAQSLAPMFSAAARRLATAQDERERQYARWGAKIAVESGTFALKSPAMDAVIFATVTRALFMERRLRIVYRARSGRADNKSQEILPLGMVQVGSIVYLIGGREGKAEPAMYRLNRIDAAEMMLESFRYPANFSLDDYVNKQRQFDFMVEGEIALTLRFRNGAGDHLLESPMCEDQSVQRADGFLVARGTVVLSQRLRWWLRSFGPHVEVLEPALLRQEFIAEAAELGQLYRVDPGHPSVLDVSHVA